MASFIALMIVLGILLFAVLGAIGMWMAGEKGLSTTKGFLYGAFIPVIGLIIIGTTKASDETLVKEMYDRNLLSKEEYENTMEIKINKNNK